MTLLRHSKVWALLIGLSSFLSSYGQTIVKGTIKDAVTGELLPFVSIYFKDGQGVVSDSGGHYSMQTSNSKLKTLEFSRVGYKTITKTITPLKTQTLNISLERGEALNNVTVTSNKRAKYRNKDNPAVELIRKVIDNKSKNRITSYDFTEYEQYEKMEVSLTNKPGKILNSKLFKNYQFVIENQDTTKIPGKTLLPVYLQETISKKYYRKNPEKEKTVILGQKQVNYGEYIDNAGVKTYLARMYEDVDVYENNIPVLSNQFLSPIADMAPTFYMFYIRDTTEVDGTKLIRLSFYPRNPSDLLFRGTLYITLDGNYAVQKINMSIGKNTNINWARELHINQDFEKGVDGRYHLIMSDMLAEFALTKGAAGGIVGERTVSFKNMLLNQPESDSIFKGQAVVTAPNALEEPDSFWTAKRHKQLSVTESKVYSNIDSLQNMKSYKRFMDIATLLLAGYKNFGPFEVGPVNAFYSFNPVEGFRLRVGGRTTPKLSKNIYLENYVAYGFKDEKWKYFTSVAYSFNHKSVYGYPLNYLKASFQHDTKIPGQELQFVQEDNFLLSFKRGTNNMWLYNDIFKLEYTREFEKHLSYTFGYKYWKQIPAGDIIYQKQDAGGGLTTIPSVTTSELSGTLRWAPHEQFYQGKVYRVPILNKYPIFQFRYIAGIKGLAGGEYNYHNFNLNIYKRFYLSQLGMTDVVLEGSYIVGQVPFPLLSIHRANQTYALQLNSYNVMNFMEFVSDHYAALNVDHYFNGFIFNKVPLLKKLKLKEALSGKILFGAVRQENNPAYNNSVFKFPVDPHTGLPTTYTLNGKPYIEVSAGIGNIFKLIRVDYVRRLSYLDHPGIDKWGILTRVKFDF